MKKIIMGILLLSSSSLFAQDNNNDHHRNGDENNRVPENIQHSFTRDNPNAQNTQWQKTNGQWRSDYKDKDNRDATAYYRSNGKRIDTHYSYSNNELPAKVREKADHKYHSNYHAYRIDRPNAQPLFQIKIGDNAKATYYDENGNKRSYNDRH